MPLHGGVHNQDIGLCGQDRLHVKGRVVGRDDLPLILVLGKARLVDLVVALFAARIPDTPQHGKGVLPLQRDDEVDEVKGADGIASDGLLQRHRAPCGVGDSHGLLRCFLGCRFAAAAAEGAEQQEGEAQEGVCFFHGIPFLFFINQAPRSPRRPFAS